MRHVHLERLILALALLAAPAAAQQWPAIISVVSCDNFTTEPFGQIVSHLNSSDGGTSYIWSSGTTATASCEVKMGPVLDPVSSTGHWIAADFFATVGKGCSATLYLDLMQGTTVIATLSASNPGWWGTWSGVQLSAAQSNAITDYGDLRLRFRYVPGAECVSYTFYVTWGSAEVPADPRTQRVMQVQ